MSDMNEKEGASALKVSYLAKDETVCPACGAKFRREELLSGSGRLIAGDLTDELHRLYEKSAKYGMLFPLAYVATVCPECLFASMEADFPRLPKDAAAKVNEGRENRFHEVALLCDEEVTGAIDFRKPRDLASGAASQYLALRCYDYYPLEFSPTVKQGLAALRAGWLFDHLDEKYPNQHFDWLAVLFKKKAALCYTNALRRETNGKEKLNDLNNFGPDTDKNYGYEGLLYVTGLLEYKYGDTANAAARRAALDESKRNLAKMFGMGKASKSKPGSILEKTQNLYAAINKELGEVDV